MSVLSVARDASLKVGIERPEVLFASTDRTMLELQAGLNAAAEQIRDEYDWQALLKPATVTGDGALTAFPLPDDYYRMARKAELWNSTGPGWRVAPVDPEAFLERSNWTLGVLDAYWSIFGGALNIAPARSISETIRYLYISKNIVRPASGPLKAEFTNDDDTFVLDERLLRLCFITNWKRDKGFDYASEQNEYEIALNYAQSADRGPRIRRDNGHRSFVGAVPAWPWELG